MPRSAIATAFVARHRPVSLTWSGLSCPTRAPAGPPGLPRPRPQRPEPGGLLRLPHTTPLAPRSAPLPSEQSHPVPRRCVPLVKVLAATRDRDPVPRRTVRPLQARRLVYHCSFTPVKGISGFGQYRHPERLAVSRKRDGELTTRRCPCPLPVRAARASGHLPFSDMSGARLTRAPTNYTSGDALCQGASGSMGSLRYTDRRGQPWMVIFQRRRYTDVGADPILLR